MTLTTTRGYVNLALQTERGTVYTFNWLHNVGPMACPHELILHNACDGQSWHKKSRNQIRFSNPTDKDIPHGSFKNFSKKFKDFSRISDIFQVLFPSCTWIVLFSFVSQGCWRIKFINQSVICLSYSSLHFFYALHFTSLYFNPLSQEGGSCCNPPFRFSLVPFLHFCLDCHTVNLPTLCPNTHVSMKKFFKNFCCEKSWGVGGLQQPPPSVLRGKGWQQK